MQPTLQLMAELELLTWEEALETNAHLKDLETFNLLAQPLQRKIYLAQALLNWDPEEWAATAH